MENSSDGACWSDADWCSLTLRSVAETQRTFSRAVRLRGICELPPKTITLDQPMKRLIPHLHFPRRLAHLGLMLVGLSSASSFAHAGNLDSFYVSGEAPLQAGAVVATSSTGGSIWYNPAGMAQLTGTRLDVNVSGYAVRFGAHVKFDSTLPNPRERRLILLELDVVPAAVTLTRRFGKFGIGLGVFVPAQTSVTLRTHLAASDATAGQALEFGYDSKAQYREYHAGPGIGWDLTPDLRLGMSLLANYRTYSESTDVSASLTERSDTSATNLGWAQHHRVDSAGVGLELILGTQWRIGRGYTLGFVVRSPSLRLGQVVEQIDTEMVAGPDGVEEQTIDFDEDLALGTQVLSPFRFHLGLSRKLGNFTTSVEGSLLLPYENEAIDVAERATFNARLGLMAELDATWSLGGGLFTDRSPAPLPEAFLEKKIDYYGATFAVNWKRPYGIYSRGGAFLDDAQPLVFGTTLALSYALGVGTIAGALIGPGTDGGIELQAQPADVFAHEFLLHIATTIAE